MMLAFLLAAADVPMVPGWAINRKAERCVATATLASSGGTVMLEVESPISTDFAGTLRFTLPVWKNHDGLTPPTSFTETMAIRPTGLVGRVRYTTGQPTVSMALEPRQIATLTRDEKVSLEIPNRPALRLRLRYTPQLQAALRTCRDDILRGWGADPAALTGSGSAKKTASWFTSKDYPGDALRDGIEGRVLFLASVDRSGKPMSCKIVSSSNSMSLDATTCELALLRGTYPAAEASGPARRWAIGLVRWQLGE